MIISRVIWIYNVLIALLDLIFLIYRNFISTNVLNNYNVVKEITIINSNYIDRITHILQIIVLDDSDQYDSSVEIVKLSNSIIKMKFLTFLYSELRLKSDKFFVDRESAFSDL